MPGENIDAFLLFNHREMSAVKTLARDLEARGVSTHYWDRIEPGLEDWTDREAQRLRDAKTAVVFLGDHGWGPGHLRTTEEAQELGKRLIPVLIGEPADEDFVKAGALFRKIRYLDLRDGDRTKTARLANAILGRDEAPPSGRLDRIISGLVDGSDEQRADILHQIARSKLAPAESAELSNRLRIEIRNNFAPSSETAFASAIRDPKKISSIRSWMLSTLIWTDPEDLQSREIILDHLVESREPNRNVRFWVLAGLYSRRVSYLSQALQVSRDDAAPEVSSLSRAATDSLDPSFIEQLRIKLRSDDFETVWQVLRVLRIVAITELTGDVWAQLDRSPGGTPIAYDALYALSTPEMAQAAAMMLSEKDGLEDLVARVVGEARRADRNATRHFAALLAAFESAHVERLLDRESDEPDLRDVIRTLRLDLKEYRDSLPYSGDLVPGITPDTIDISKNELDIAEDIHTLTAVMLAKAFAPPLAIGIFGDWGSGKSFFMQSMRAVAEERARRAKASGDSVFCAEIVSIEFNAWHYVDTNLWASLASHILAKLVEHVSPQTTGAANEAELLAQLGSAKSALDNARTEKERAETRSAERRSELENLQKARLEKELRLRDLRMSDLRNVLSSDKELKDEMEHSLQSIGATAAISSFSDLSTVVSEANTVSGRAAALFVTLLSGKNRLAVIALLLTVLLVPLVLRWLKIMTPDVTGISQLIIAVGGITTILHGAVSQVTTNLAKIEDAKRRVDKAIADRRKDPSGEEVALEAALAQLRIGELEATSRLTAATALVAELEKRLVSLVEERSLSRFLAERTRSDDYTKHLGLISTIRTDFDVLSERLLQGKGDGLGPDNPVERVVLYIDDLDRCPVEKVMEVLQAVHLLLAYPLFVVVVGVDPRWLVESLERTYPAFRHDEEPSPISGRALITPQDYLEKIFQIPFALRPMNSDGYARLVQSLLLPPTTARTAVAPSGAGTRATEPPIGGSDTHLASTPRGGDDVPSMRENGTSGQPSAEPLMYAVEADSLEIKAWEAKFAERLFPLIPTPRAAKRFSNVYRILKAPIRRENLSDFEGTAALPGSFQVPMLLLAILIGAPKEAARLFPVLQRYADAGRNVTEALMRLTSIDVDFTEPGFANLEDRVRPLLSDGAVPTAPAIFAYWLPRVARFSFEAGQALQQARSTPLP